MEIKYNNTTILDSESGIYKLKTKDTVLSSNIMINIPKIFKWGDQTATADATWFADLQEYLQDNPGKESWVGRTKSVTLTSEVLGTTTHLIRCIGVNQDADNTVTFQTDTCLATSITFSSLPFSTDNYANGTNYYHSSNLIYDGNASGACKLYYDAFPGKASIKQLNKGTCVIQVSDKNGTATYQNQYVWIPSEGEIGFDRRSSLIYSNWTTTNGECTYGKKFQYSYYNSDESRQKDWHFWWLRSRGAAYAFDACCVYVDGSSYIGAKEYNEEAIYVAPAFCIGI